MRKSESEAREQDERLTRKWNEKLERLREARPSARYRNLLEARCDLSSMCIESWGNARRVFARIIQVNQARIKHADGGAHRVLREQAEDTRLRGSSKSQAATALPQQTTNAYVQFVLQRFDFPSREVSWVARCCLWFLVKFFKAPSPFCLLARSI